ncbi:SH3 domain-containing protein [Intestinibacter bartlettii]|uniref:SH3 domain-containing protein n=1 Tax=Intestinibacter bartlettii TaxID=261299 RepID=UPI0026768F03|nr:SH3 domain-containing protein [Intestinibacter bartlettii]
MKVEKRIIAMIMAMYIGTSNALAQPVSGEKIGEAPINYSYTTARAKTQNGIVIKNVNLRTKPNKTTSKIIRTLKVGEKVIIVGKSGNYYKIEYASGKFAYAYANNYIKIEEAKPNDKPDVKLDNNVGISTANVNVRTSPNANIATNKIGKLLKGTKVEVVGQSGDFYKIRYQGQYAYASKYYISVTKGLKLDKISEIKLKSDIVVRELASTSSKQISTLSQGTVVSVVEKLTNNWYKIELNDGYGYAIIEDKSYDKPNDKPDVKLDNNVGISTANVNVRTSPNANIATNKIGKLLKGTKVEVVGQSGDFYKIRYQGQYAYASKYYISVTKGLKLDKISEIKLKSDIVVRELASTSSKQISTLSQGTVVSVVEKLTNNWYKIELNDGYGYAIIEDKSDEKPETKISVIGVTTTSLNVRTEPDTNISTNIIGVLSQDTKIEIVEEVNDFYKIKYKGQYAYVAKSYVSVKQNMKLDKVADLKLTTDVVVRELASDTSDSIFTLKQGTKVTVVENFLNGWYKIYVNNIYGYINTKDNVSSSIGIATGDVNIRTEANTNSNIVGVLLKGSKIEIAGQSGNFYKVKYKGLYRYISKKYLSDNESEKLNNVGVLKIAQEAEVKELASDDSITLLTLQEGTTVNVIERLFNGWYKIEINNVYGYIKPTDGNLVSSDKDINLMKEDGYYYYINPDGTKYKGYKVVDGIQYYFSDETGESIDQFAVVREKENGKTVTNRYFVKENGGVLKNTFRSIPELNDKLYYFGADGKAVRGINTINGKKYYFNTRYSYIMTGLCSVNENIYYFNKSNYTMETNTTKIVAGKLKLDIGSDGRVYNMTKLDDSDLANMLYSGFSKMGTVYSHNYEEGLDCSNYVSEILREIGLNTFSKDERTSQQQAIYCEQNNLTVSKKNLQPGDILFYNNTNCSNIKKYGHCSRALENGMHVHHVAIYIGDGKIMESTSGVNKDYEHAGVRIYNISQSSTYYIYSAARVLGIKRPVTPENPDKPENPDTPENPDNKGDQENNNQTNKDDRVDNGNIENNDVKNEE